MFVLYEQVNGRNIVMTATMSTEFLSEELLIRTVEITSIPIDTPQFGKQSVLCINPSNKQLFYEYDDRPLTEQERIQQLEDMVANLLLVTSGGVL